MKKLLAVILSVICLFSCMGPTAFAIGDIVGGVLGDDIGGILGGEDEPIVYGITYEMEFFSDVTLIYQPMATLSFSNPGTYIVSKDTPIAIDHEFICWDDGKGNYYYAGDSLYVDGQITLYAVWKEKTDKDAKIIRIIKATMEALKRIFQKFLGIFDSSVEFYENYHNSITETPDEITLELPVAYAVYEKGRIKVCIDPQSLNLPICIPVGDIKVKVNEAEIDQTFYFSEMLDGEGRNILLIDIGEIAAPATISFTLPEKMLDGTNEIKGYKEVEGKWVYQTMTQIQSTTAYEVVITVE